MTCKVITLFTVKTKQGDLTLHPGQVVTLEEVKAKKLIGEGKLIPLPFITDFGVLVIPFNSDKKYHYWNGGQSVCDTLKELGRCDLIEKYKSLYN